MRRFVTMENNHIDLREFNFSGNGIRIVIIENEPWFVAKDICNALEHTDSRKAVSRLDEDEKLMGTMFLSGQQRETWFINEQGLYILVFTSRKPEAKSFVKWIKNEILPSIRKTGSYSVEKTQEIEDPKYLVAKALIAASKMIEEKDAEILELKPKADFADYIHSNSKTYSFREAAKLLGFKDIGEKTLFQFCRDQQFLMLNNEPYQTYMAQGLFKQVTEKFEKASGDQGVYLKTVITGKGLDIVSKKLSEKGYSRVNEFVLEEALLV